MRIGAQHLAECLIDKIPVSMALNVATKLRRKTDELKTGNVEVLYKDDKLILVVPLDLAASITWGQATDWCTARPENTMFARYTRDGPLFIIWYDYGDLSDPNKGVKYQFHFESDQFMKYDDTPVRNLTTFCKELPIELREKMYAYHSKAPTSHNDAARNFMERILFPEKLVAKIVQSSGAKCPPDTDLRVLCAEKEITPQTFNAAIQSMHGHGYNCYHMDEDESLWLKLADLEYADGLFKSSNYVRLILQGGLRIEALPSEVGLDELVQMADHKTNAMADEIFPDGWIKNSTVRMQFARIYVDTEDLYYGFAAQEAAIDLIAQNVSAEDGQVRHTANGTEFLLTSDRYTLPRYLETYEDLLVCTLGKFKSAFDDGHGKIPAPDHEIDQELRKKRPDMRREFNEEAQKYLAELASENKEMEARPDFVPNRPTPDSAHRETGSEEHHQPPTSDAIPDPAVEQIPLEEPDKTDQT